MKQTQLHFGNESDNATTRQTWGLKNEGSAGRRWFFEQCPPNIARKSKSKNEAVMELIKNRKVKRQTVAVHWQSPVMLTYHALRKRQDSAMKALIIYDDFPCAANTNAMLHQAAHHADATVKCDVRPWRLNMLKLPPTADEALSDAVDAHLVVFAICRTPSLPAWLKVWLEQWAARRRTSDAALAIIDGGNANASIASATIELSEFARRHGLSFIGHDDQNGRQTGAPLTSNRERFLTVD